MKKKVLVALLCPTLCDPMDYSLPGFSTHGILQARILEWVAIPFSRGSSWPRDWALVSCIVVWFFTIWATREAWVFFFFLISIKTEYMKNIESEFQPSVTLQRTSNAYLPYRAAVPTCQKRILALIHSDSSTCVIFHLFLPYARGKLWSRMSSQRSPHCLR